MPDPFATSYCIDSFYKREKRVGVLAPKARNPPRIQTVGYNATRRLPYKLTLLSQRPFSGQWQLRIITPRAAMLAMVRKNSTCGSNRRAHAPETILSTARRRERRGGFQTRPYEAMMVAGFVAFIATTP